MRLVLVYNLVWIGQPGQAPKLHRESPAEVQLTRALTAWEADLADGSTQQRMALLLGGCAAIVATATAAAAAAEVAAAINGCWFAGHHFFLFWLLSHMCCWKRVPGVCATVGLDTGCIKGELHAASVADRSSTCASSCLSAGLLGYMLLALRAIQK
jgi:hypothetical protein